MRKFRISNPYESVASLIGIEENHYKTNLHTHSTYSNANDTMTILILSYKTHFGLLTSKTLR